MVDSWPPHRASLPAHTHRNTDKRIMQIHNKSGLHICSRLYFTHHNVSCESRPRIDSFTQTEEFQEASVILCFWFYTKGKTSLAIKMDTYMRVCVHTHTHTHTHSSSIVTPCWYLTWRVGNMLQWSCVTRCPGDSHASQPGDKDSSMC